MIEYAIDIRNLIKDISSEIIISDEQIDETGETVREPVLVFATGEKKMGYISVFTSEKVTIREVNNIEEGKKFANSILAMAAQKQILKEQ